MLIYLIIIGFFLSFLKWDISDIWIGITNLISSIIFTIIFFYIVKYIFNLIGNYYGLLIDFDTVKLTKKIRKYVLLKKEFVERDRIIDFSYLFTIILGFITFGYIVPILFSINPIIIESKRIGKSKSLEAGEEVKRIIFFGFLSLWVIFSIIKYFSQFSPILYGFTDYFFRFLLYLTYFSIIPWQLIFTPFISKYGYTYGNMDMGDRLFVSTDSFLLGVTISLLFIPIFSLFLDPITTLLLSLLIYGIIWLRYSI